MTDPLPTSPLDPVLLGASVKAALKVDDPSVARAIGAAPITLDAAVAALTRAGIRLSKCKLHHVHKALVRPPVAPPVLATQGVTSLTLTITPYHPLFDVPAAGYDVEIQGVARHRVPGGAAGSVDDRAAPAPVVHTVEGLTRGTAYTLCVHCVVEDPLLAATLRPSTAITVRTLDPPGAPPAPVVVDRGTDFLMVRVMNVGLASDPRSTGVVVEVDGERLVAVASGEAEVLIDVGELEEGSRHTLRARCTVGDATVDGTLPWSPVVVARTMTDMEVGYGILFNTDCAPVITGTAWFRDFFLSRLSPLTPQNVRCAWLWPVSVGDLDDQLRDAVCVVRESSGTAGASPIRCPG